MARRLYRSAAMTAVSFTVLIMAGAAQAQTKRYQDCRWEPNRPLAQHRHMGQSDCMVMPGSEVRSTGAVAGIETRRAGTGRSVRSGTAAGRVSGPTMLAQVPAMQSRDCRYEPNLPMAAPYWVDQNGCLRMRRGNEDVFVTGAIDRAPPVSPVGRVGSGPGNPPGGGVGLPPAGGASPVTDIQLGPVSNNPRTDTPVTDGPLGPVANNPRTDSPTDTPKADGPKGGNPKGDTPRGRNGAGDRIGHNPGNDEDVGRAGESPNGRDFGDGSRGRSDVTGREAAGDNGDKGDHGNNGFGNGGPDGSNAGKQDTTR
jgi:hypothetical protein